LGLFPRKRDRLPHSCMPGSVTSCNKQIIVQIQRFVFIKKINKN
jgi:hypothetical protein